MLGRWFTPPKQARRATRDGHPAWADSAALIALQSQASALGLGHQHKVLSAQAGGFISPFRGRGVDFDEVRPYLPGDEVRNIDWRVTARTGRPHTKLYREERERPVVLWVDRGPSMRFGTRVAFKSRIAAETATLIAWAATANGDRVGGLVFDESGHQESAPRSRKAGALGLIRLLGRAPQEGTEGRYAHSALRRLAQATHPGGVQFLISDFRFLDPESERLLLRLARHQDLVLIAIADPLELTPPPPGHYRISDGEHQTLIDSGNRHWRTAIEAQAQAHEQQLSQLSRRLGAHLITLRTDDPLPDTLRRALRSRRGHALSGYRSMHGAPA